MGCLALIVMNRPDEEVHRICDAILEKDGTALIDAICSDKLPEIIEELERRAKRIAVVEQNPGSGRGMNHRSETMSRSGYVDDIWDHLALGRYRGRVASAIRGRRGQAFLRELAAAMDAMQKKVLIADQLIDENGDCCAIGVVCKARGLDVSGVDYEDSEQVGSLVGIASVLAAEIEYENDDDFGWLPNETPENRWKRMRKWIDRKIIQVPADP